MARRFILGVTAGIAAYKVAGLVRHWVKAGDDVTVIPTAASLNFVGKATWEALSGHGVHCDVFEGASSVEHVDYARQADAIVIAPATADACARLAGGMANDLLTSTVLAATCPVVICPAMHSAMWDNPATQRNIEVLKSYGYHIIDPAVGALTSGDSGVGRLPDIEDIARGVDSVLGKASGILAGKHVVISGGGTREAIDPVRFIGNASSGKQAAALALEARKEGARVTFVAAHIEDSVRAQLQGIAIVDAPTAASMKESMSALALRADIVIMTAAVADFRPRYVNDGKIKKTSSTFVPRLELEQTDDVLAGLVASRSHNVPFIIGFAAETGSAQEVLEKGRAKISRKGCDLLVINNVSRGEVFGQDTNSVTVIQRGGDIVASVVGSKRKVAQEIIRAASQAMAQ